MRKIALLLVLVALVACDEQSSDSGMPSMADHRFTPETMTVATGEVVTWVNDTDEAHTVTAVESSIPEGAEYFSSGGAPTENQALGSLADEFIDPGEKFEWTFEEPGTYRYYCIPHKSDGMQGTVVVE